MKESKFQSELIKELKREFPGCIVLKNDPNYIQGIPDLLILFKDKWAVLEVKKSSDSPHQPNQTYTLRCMDDEGKASTSEIAAQLGKTTTQCSMYRERLLERRLIVPAGRGFVRFGLPYCPQYFDEEDAIGDASAEWRY